MALAKEPNGYLLKMYASTKFVLDQLVERNQKFCLFIQKWKLEQANLKNPYYYGSKMVESIKDKSDELVQIRK